jgi:tetratricopeptide (TPR) repeat protein
MSMALFLFITMLVPQTASPRSPEADTLTSRGDAQMMNRQFDAAIKLYRDALAISPGHPLAHRGLGRVLDLQGRHAEAQLEYQSALKLANLSDRSQLQRLLAISYTFQRRFDEAERAQRQWFDDAQARYGRDGLPLGYLDFYDLAFAKGDFAEAERVLDTFYGEAAKAAAKMDPKLALLSGIEQARYRLMRAIVSARSGRLDDARARMRDAEAQLADAWKKLQAAAPSDMPLPSLDGNADEMMFPAGELAFWLGDPARTIRAMAPLMVKLPRHNWLLGQAYEKVGDQASAREAYRRIVESPLLNLQLAWTRPLAEARLQALGR